MPETQTTSTEDKRHSMLVVDDSEDVHRLLQARLRQENIDLIAALDGKTSLALAEQECPSLILLDLDMPDMDGFEVLRHLKDNAETRDIPVIVLSGLHSPAAKQPVPRGFLRASAHSVRARCPIAVIPRPTITMPIAGPAMSASARGRC